MMQLHMITSQSSHIPPSLVPPDPFRASESEERSGDSGQDVVTQWNVIMPMLHNVGMQLLAYCIMILVITCERHVVPLACTVRSSLRRVIKGLTMMIIEVGLSC